MTEPMPGAVAADAQPTRSVGERALNWWRYHFERPNRDASVRARLRRCRSPIDVLAITPAISLARQVGALRAGTEADDQRFLAALNLARVLAHVERNASRRPMEAAGWQRFPGDRPESDAGKDRPRLSEARFHRLLETGPGEELVTAFVRLVRLLDGEVNVSALASDFLDWSHPYRGERVRRRWAFDYYAAGNAAPADPPSSEDDE